ncbi:MAG: SDR family oxidoreductase [Chitinophagales bacterium]|nr:SDR family oxidoreductase [Chitinophagales bacterium]
MKVLVTGSNGFLGYYLVKQLTGKNYDVIATGKGICKLPLIEGKRSTYYEMDLTDPFQVHDVFEKTKPDIVIHSGAMSKPDECEADQWRAYLTNVEGTVSVMLNASENKSHLIFLSTDFIFNGQKGMYSENDTPDPVNYYGKTKAEAEDVIKEYEHDWTIVRTITVYGRSYSGRKSFPEVIREKLEKKERYNVFDDQIRTPTYAEDLVSGIISVIEKRATGIYHLSGSDVLTPYQMACDVAEHLKMDGSLLKRVVAAEFPQPALRPLKTGFIIDKAKRDLGFDPVGFREGLIKTFS